MLADAELSEHLMGSCVCVPRLAVLALRASGEDWEGREQRRMETDHAGSSGAGPVLSPQTEGTGQKAANRRHCPTANKKGAKPVVMEGSQEGVTGEGRPGTTCPPAPPPDTLTHTPRRLCKGHE